MVLLRLLSHSSHFSITKLDASSPSFSFSTPSLSLSTSFLPSPPTTRGRRRRRGGGIGEGGDGVGIVRRRPREASPFLTLSAQLDDNNAQLLEAPSTAFTKAPLVTHNAEEDGYLRTDLLTRVEYVDPSSPPSSSSSSSPSSSEESKHRVPPTKNKKGDDDLDRYQIRHGRQIFEERAFLVGIEQKGGDSSMFSITDSLEELAQLADTDGLRVVGSTYQKLDHPNPRTYIGAGKVAEVQMNIRALDVETVIFDDELSAGQLRKLEKAFGDNVRICDRTSLILDIFSQRAATREANLQVELARIEYQLPRLTRMWTHLERQAGGMVKGMGEKQIEVDKRILRSRISVLRKDLESVREHRRHYRERRASVPTPVVSLVGYTNAGKSTLLNRLTGAGVLAEDRLFATLDPTTRRIELPNGKECLITDTVGFIQKLPTQLVASFRATLEEINDSSLLVHVVDISHPLAIQQIKTVNNVLSELNVGHIPQLMIWNKIDKAGDLAALKEEIGGDNDIVCISALTGDGIEIFLDSIQKKLRDTLAWVEALIPYEKGDLIDSIHRLGIVDKVEYLEEGIAFKAYVPLSISRQLQSTYQCS